MALSGLGFAAAASEMLLRTDTYGFARDLLPSNPTTSLTLGQENLCAYSVLSRTAPASTSQSTSMCVKHADHDNCRQCRLCRL